MRNNWLILLDENKVTGEIREITWPESGQICSLQCFLVPELSNDQTAELWLGLLTYLL